MQLAPPILANVVQELAVLSQQRATGELILSSENNQWHLHLFFGRLVYATGGTHRVRRWHRAVTQYCPGFKSDICDLNDREPWESYLLHQGINRNQLSLTQAKNVISRSTHEVLFTLVGHSELTSLWLVKKQRPIALLEVKEFLSNAQQWWQEWQELGLEDLCPNQAPVLEQSLAELNLEADETLFSLTQLINGENTIWDIALKTEQPVTAVAIALQHLANQGLIKLQTVPDIPTPVIASVSLPLSVLNNQPWIACIADRPNQSSVRSPETPATREFVGTDEAVKQIHTGTQRQLTESVEKNRVLLPNEVEKTLPEKAWDESPLQEIEARELQVKNSLPEPSFQSLGAELESPVLQLGVSFVNQSDINEAQAQNFTSTEQLDIEFQGEIMSTTLRKELGDFSSIVCFKAVIEGMEDALGEKATAIALTTAGRTRGKKLAQTLGLANSGISLEEAAQKIGEALGQSGTRLCKIEKIVQQEDTIKVYTSETLCSAGEVEGSPRKCTFTLGAVWGALEQIVGKRLQGKQTESILRGGSYDVFEFTVL